MITDERAAIQQDCDLLREGTDVTKSIRARGKAPRMALEIEKQFYQTFGSGTVDHDILIWRGALSQSWYARILFWENRVQIHANGQHYLGTLDASEALSFEADTSWPQWNSSSVRVESVQVLGANFDLSSLAPQEAPEAESKLKPE